MSVNTRVLRHLAAHVHDGETIEVAVIAQLKRGMKKQLGKGLATGLVTGLATTAATGGAGLIAFTVPPAVWVVVTSHRVLLFTKTHSASKPGDLVFEAPRPALTASLKSGLLTQVTVADRSDGQSLLRLNLGMKRRAAKSIVTSIER
ncbi:hypothetical protein ACRYCC_42775 [Actinomadura scrupuli]|uniref:hypothetical protein n=1 Tax=Actinomadura scrupuli TaxID=559629 RepID=UPI003D97C47B